MKKPSLKQRLTTKESSKSYEFRQIREDAVELLINGEGYAGEYTISHARRVCREMGLEWRRVFKKW